MKYLMSACLVMLIACGKSGGNDPITGNPPGLAPTCKAFKSSWISTLGVEQYDFSTLTFTTSSWTAYQYTASNAETCSVPLDTKLYPGNHVVTDAGFHYVIEFRNNSPSVACSFWQDGTGPHFGKSATHGSAVIKVECDKITMCKSILMNPGECVELL